MSVQQSGFAGFGIKDLVDKNLARYSAQADEKIAILRQQRQQMEAQRAEMERQALAQQTGQAGGYIDPIFDPNSRIGQAIAKAGITPEQYLNDWSEVKRQREIVDPLLETRWLEEIASNPQLQGLSSKQLDKMKEQFFNQERTVYRANFTRTEEDESTFGGMLRDVGGSIVYGGGNVLDAVAGLSKAALGKDSSVAGAVRGAAKAVQDFGDGIATDSAVQLRNYANELAAQGKVQELAKLVADYPQILRNTTVQMVGEIGVYGKGAKALGAGMKLASKSGTVTKAADAVAKVGSNMPAYSAVMTSGSVANALADAGHDPNDIDKFLSIVAAGAVSAGATFGVGKVLGPTAEQQITKLISGQGITNPAVTKQLTHAAIEKLQQQGFVKGTATYGKGLAKNVATGFVKGAVPEMGEEAIQSTAEDFTTKIWNADGSLKTQAEIADQLYKSFTTAGIGGAALGGMVGGGMRGGASLTQNAFNRYGDADTARQVHNYNQANDNVAKGVWQDADGNDLDFMTPQQIQDAKDNRARMDAEQQVVDDLNNRYGDYGTTAKADHDAITKAGTIETDIEAIITDIVANNNGAQGVPADVARAKSIIDNIQDTTAKMGELTKWAKAIGNTEIEGRVVKITNNLDPDYEFAPNGKYVRTNIPNTDVTIESAIEKLIGKPVTDLQAEITNIKATHPELATDLDKYLHAQKDGFYKVAEEIATKFDNAVNKHVKNNPPPTPPKYGPTVGSSMNKRNNASFVSSIYRAFYGTRNWNAKNGGLKSLQDDPVAMVEDLIQQVTFADQRTLSDVHADALIKELTALRDAWANDQDFDVDTKRNRDLEDAFKHLMTVK